MRHLRVHHAGHRAHVAAGRRHYHLGHSGVHTGTEACRFPQPIGFGPFELIWASTTNGSTVGYGFGPGRNTLDRELAICATDLTGVESVEGVDAASPQWLYRRCSE